MPVLMDLPTRPIEYVRPLIEITDAPAASGADGQELMRQFESVFRHWNDRTGYLETLRNDDISPRHVPLRRAGTIKVRFQNATPMNPRRIDGEGEEGQ